MDPLYYRLAVDWWQNSIYYIPLNLLMICASESQCSSQSSVILFANEKKWVPTKIKLNLCSHFINCIFIYNWHLFNPAICIDRPNFKVLGQGTNLLVNWVIRYFQIRHIILVPTSGELDRLHIHTHTYTYTHTYIFSNYSQVYNYK